MNLIKTCLVFPGQGNQKIKMFKGNSFIKRELTKFNYNIDLLKLNNNGPLDEINKTINTQLLLILQGYSIYNNKIKSLNNLNIEYCFGNSLGEYTSLLISNSLSLLKMLDLIKNRGNLMQILYNELDFETCMLGVRTDLDTLNNYILDYQTIKIAIEVSNKTNIISGEKEEINNLKIKLKSNKILSSMFNPLYGFHNSFYMKNYENNLYNLLEKYDFRTPDINVLSNFNNEILNIKNIKNNLAKHMYSSVRLKNNIEFCLEKKVKNFIIIGKDLLIKNAIIEISNSRGINDINIEEIED